MSWETILKKRLRYREVFDGFEPALVAGYGPDKVAELLADAGIVRNRLKVESAVANAQAFLRVQRELGSFEAYLWPWVGGRPIRNAWSTPRDVPAETEESRALSRDLRKRGFRFVGPTICYAFLQAVGLVNDHLTDCFRYRELA